MNTITTIASTNTNLAIDLGKYENVAWIDTPPPLCATVSLLPAETSRPSPALRRLRPHRIFSAVNGGAE